MGLLDSVKGWLYDDETQEIETFPDDGSEYQKDYQDSKSVQGIDAFIIVEKPVHFMEAERISKHIKDGRAVIVNTENTVPEEKQRLIDFLSGVAMAKDGMIAKIYQNVFICAPKNIGVVGE